MSFIDGKSILLTGGTGSFGKRFIKKTFEKFSPAKIIVYSRDEMKQFEMARFYENEPRIRFFLGDVRDKERLVRAFNGVDVVIHAAALKIVPTAEYDPLEFVKTNIFGAGNIIDAAIDTGVKKVIALSTDKASAPINLYGGTKFVSDKLFLSANNYSGGKNTTFSVVRYGNVLASRGSVVPIFISQKEDNLLKITDERMTRFMLTLDQAVATVWDGIENSFGGEILIRKCPSMNIMDIAKTIAPSANIEFIGIRAGEKLHEQMFGVDEAHMAWDVGDYYLIVKNPERLSNSKWPCNPVKIEAGFRYTSDSNSHWLTQKEFLALLKEQLLL